ncbi:MAG TPA: hypothetical protein VGK19_05715 [Capsulimonadaceae bacterium]|jgi:hypothetical protein
MRHLKTIITLALLIATFAPGRAQEFQAKSVSGGGDIITVLAANWISPAQLKEREWSVTGYYMGSDGALALWFECTPDRAVAPSGNDGTSNAIRVTAVAPDGKQYAGTVTRPDQAVQSRQMALIKVDPRVKYWNIQFTAPTTQLESWGKSIQITLNRSEIALPSCTDCVPTRKAALPDGNSVGVGPIKPGLWAGSLHWLCDIVVDNAAGVTKGDSWQPDRAFYHYPDSDEKEGTIRHYGDWDANGQPLRENQERYVIDILPPPAGVNANSVDIRIFGNAIHTDYATITLSKVPIPLRGSLQETTITATDPMLGTLAARKVGYFDALHFLGPRIQALSTRLAPPTGIAVVVQHINGAASNSSIGSLQSDFSINLLQAVDSKGANLIRKGDLPSYPPRVRQDDLAGSDEVTGAQTFYILPPTEAAATVTLTFDVRRVSQSQTRSVSMNEVALPEP